MERPLRILTFLHSFEPGGVERVALRLVTAWRAAGIDAPLVMGRDDGIMRREWPDIAYQSLASGRLETGWFETLWMITRLPAQIRRLQPDVLFCAGNSYTIVSVAMKLVLGKTCPPIMAKISNDLGRTDMPALFRGVYGKWLKIQGRSLDVLVGMAEPMRQEIAVAMGAPDERIAIVNDPALNDRDIVAATAFDVHRPDDRPGTRYVAAGRLSSQKNFPLLLQAFSAVAGPDDILTIYGEGPDRGGLQALAKKLKISDRLFLPGHTHPIIPALANHDVYVLSSDYEGVPAVIIEALTAGLPIVATNCSVSMADLLGEGEFGELVPVGNAPRLASAMRTARQRGQDRGAARNQAGRFTVETAAFAYADLAATMVAHRDHDKNISLASLQHAAHGSLEQDTSTAVSAMHGTAPPDQRSGTAFGSMGKGQSD